MSPDSSWSTRSRPPPNKMMATARLTRGSNAAPNSAFGSTDGISAPAVKPTGSSTIIAGRGTYRRPPGRPLPGQYQRKADEDLGGGHGTDCASARHHEDHPLVTTLTATAKRDRSLDPLGAPERGWLTNSSEFCRPRATGW